MKQAFTLTPLTLLSIMAPPAAHAFSLSKALAEISTLFPNNIAFKGADAVIAGLEATAGRVLGYTETRNDLVDGDCGDVLVVFARGTGEPGNIGALVGPAFLEELVAALPGRNVSMQGLDSSAYPATVAQYFTGGSTTGATAMASYVTLAAKKCTGTSIIMSGWSQGAQVVHLAAKQVGTSGMADVSAVVTFGDPDKSSTIAGISASKVKVICHENDDICQFGDILMPTHFTYAEDTPAAAEFVASVL